MIVVVRNLSHSYGPRAALSDVGFAVPRGSIFGVLGPNGGGKSTLFRILSTLLSPRSGSVEIDGLPIDAKPSEVRRRIGVVFQSQSLDRKLTVRENMDSQGRLFGLSGTILRERIDEALVRLGLADRASDLVATLSGGLKRRVEIAKALLHKPSVLLMDEPSTGLDPSVRFELWKHLEELRVRESVTILVTTHILEEAERCDQLLMLHQGRVVRAGTPADLKATVGGDVLDLGARNAEELYARLTEHFAVLPLRINGRLRLEVPEGDRFLARILTAFPGLVDSVSLRKPTLEDVFLSETGSRLGE